MGLFGLIGRICSGSKLRHVAELIAARSRDTVWERVRQRVVMMGAAEARGYIRARAAKEIHAQLSAVVADNGKMNPAMRERLFALASELVMDRASLDAEKLRQARKALQPAIPVRRAA